MARFITGVIRGALAGTAIAALAEDVKVTLKNGTLERGTIVRDDETLCADPALFVRGRQIQCA